MSKQTLPVDGIKTINEFGYEVVTFGDLGLQIRKDGKIVVEHKDTSVALARFAAILLKELSLAVQAERKEIFTWLTTGIGYEIDGVDYVKLDDLLERYDEAVKALTEKEANE